MKEQNIGEKKVTRRRFLDIFIGGAFITSAFAVITSTIAYVLPPKRSEGASGGKTEVAPVDKLSPGTAIKTFHQGKPIIVGQTQQGRYFALSAICTHLGCIVDWDKPTQLIKCPCHAAVFDTYGTVLAGPAPKPLPSYSVNTIAGKIYVG
ncbi:MAG: ubiquinol-cytochrome c reductase iron-sulfur subunit [Candidatus Poribacteria bacterium]